MKTFKSLNDLVWWLQNNGGGEVKISVSAGTDATAVIIRADAPDGRGWFGNGAYLKEAVQTIVQEKGA